MKNTIKKICSLKATNSANMKKSIVLAFILLAILSCNSETNHKIENKSVPNILVDEIGNEVEIPQKGSKVISLAPNLTEIFFFLDLENQLIGNTLYCNFPTQAEKIAKVGDLITLDYEKIMELKPDIILMTIEGNQKNQYQKLKELGFNIYVTNPRNFDGIFKSIISIGKLFGKEKLARGKIDSLDLIVQNVTKFKKNSRKAVFLISVRPFIAASKNTFVNEYLKKTGLENGVFSDKINYPVLNPEELIRIKPQVIILPKKLKNEFEAILNENLLLKNELRTTEIIPIDENIYFKPGPRFVEALLDLSRKIR